MKIKNTILYALLLVPFFPAFGAPERYVEREPNLNYPAILPKPVSVVYADEGHFTVSDGTSVITDGEVDFDLFYMVTSRVRRAYPELWIKPLPKVLNTIQLRINPQIRHREGYRIDISPDTLRIEARDRAGMLYGVHTFLQLLPPSVYRGIEIEHEYRLPAQTIEDYPTFEYRGVMLDVARTFQPKENVLRLLDLMAAHKLNKLHFHLADDEGWRIELDCYPELAHTGGFRGGDSPVKPIYGKWDEKYGGYYTKAELAEIVRYAADRNIEVIPEIDLPGHSRAAAKVHPEILCNYRYNTGITAGDDRRNVWCVAREQNYIMLGKIIREVAEIFPSRYFHIGGDEVYHGQWNACPECKKLMKEQGYKKAAQLEDYFIDRMSDILRSAGKIPAVWDEAIKRDTLATDVVVHAWSNIDTGLKATEDGYHTVMMPGQYFYIDMKQAPEELGQTWAGVVPMERIYNFGLERNGFDEDQRANVKGVEAAFFSELLLPHGRDHDYFDYMLWPRLVALAEVGWTSESRRNWEEFNSSLNGSHLDRLYAMGVNYRVEPPVVDYKDGYIRQVGAYAGGTVRYTADGSEPTPDSELWTGAIKTEEPWDYRFAAFRGRLKSTTVTPKAVYTFRVEPKKQQSVEIPLGEFTSVADTGLWYIRARSAGINFRINKLEFAGTDKQQVQTLVARGQNVNDLHLMRWYVTEDNLDGKATVTVTNSGPFGADIVLELSRSPYIQPEVKFTSSLKASRNFPFRNLEDYNFTTYTRTASTCKEGDWFLFTFTEPVDAESIEVLTGLSYMPRYNVLSGRVQISDDGIDFTDVAELDHGGATVYPEGKIKALRIVSDRDGNSEAAVALQDLKIKPRKHKPNGLD
ncbi:MAG: family 20 glycosylhydrolase [Alistipes sp.]|nr:family 20 glycosylhydrolase [Alistipes sp.]